MHKWRSGFPPFSITHLHNAGHCSVERMVPATPRRCFQKTDLDTFSFGVSDFLRELKRKKAFFEELLGYPLKNKKLYKQALVHKSFNKTKNNERLEFLGDAVLSSVVSETLYNLDLSESEGILSSKRALIISRKNLNNIAKEILDEKYLIHKTKRISENMYGNYLEAIIGGLYLDQGLKRTERFIKDKILDRPHLNKELQKDFKSNLLN